MSTHKIADITGAYWLPFVLKKPGDTSSVTGVQINNSNYGYPLPIVYGQGRLGTNLLWYANFQSHSQSQSGKGGGGVVTYTYTADVMLALCEGTIIGVPTIYKDRGKIAATMSETALQQEGLTLSTGAQTQPIWSYLESTYPSQALAYAGTAWVARASMPLDQSGGIPNYNLEIAGLLQYGGGIVDASPPDVFVDLLSNARYGSGFPATSIGDLTDYRNYCIANDFFISPVVSEQKQIQQHLSDWISRTNSEAIWSQAALKIIPYGDMPVTGNGVTWNPNNASVATLNDDDYVTDKSKDPISVQRISPSDAYNDIKIEYLDRSNNYNSVMVEAMDQVSIDQYGLRATGQESAHEICTASRAQKVAQLKLQRSIYIRNTYTFTLPISYCWLEPMDIVQINDTLLGYVNKPVRLISIQEDDNFNLNCTAEDWFLGVGTVITSATEPVTPFMLPSDAAPGSISTPALFVAPPALTNGANAVWMAVAGVNSNWGGCQVWASFDNSTYTQIGTIEGRSTYGSSTATFASGSDPDTTNTLHLDLSASIGVLDPVSTSIADSGGSQCWIGGEVIDYSAATLTSANHYDLGTYIRRGRAGTSISSHSSGSDFALLDGHIFAYDFTSSSIGSTLYLKFPSFNSFGNQLEDISTVTAYSIVLNPSSSVNEITQDFPVGVGGPYTLSHTPAGPIKVYFDGILQPSSNYSNTPGSTTVSLSGGVDITKIITVTVVYPI